VIEGWQRQGVTSGTTLPGRWRRSVDDAHWAIEKKAPVRVVKGQWPDPAAPHRDMRAGYLEVIDALAGRAASVGVATHDVALAATAIKRLRSRGTPVFWELLYGLPTQAALRMAQTLAVDVRMYVPFGRSYLPYALGRLAAQPRMAMWLIKDLLSVGR
jgi:proline dehydrogenase